MSRPRVAIVAPSLDIVGGQGVQAHALTEALRRDGWPVDFVAVNPRFPHRLRRLRGLRGVRTVVNEALYLPALARLRRADVVHVFSASYWSFLLAPVPAMLAARAAGARVVLNYHSGEAADHLGRWGALVHPWLRLADAIVVPSAYLAAVFARHGHHARVVPNVVDLARFRYRERRPLRPRLVSSRNLEPYYRVDTTLQAFALLGARQPAATLTIAGVGSLEPSLRTLATALGCRGARFVGRVERAAMPRLYDEADVFVNASVLDNQPVSILEAFASGLPVVSTAAGGIGALVRDGETGLVVPPGDPGAMAAAVTRLVEDGDLARALARRAHAEAAAFTWPRVRRAWQAIYTEAAA